MMHLLSDLNDFVIDANDGKIGKVKDFYFDDRRWVIRYVVVEINSGIGNRKILLSPSLIKHLNLEEKSIAVDMSVAEISSSTAIDTTFSVSQYEIDYLSYYGYAFFGDNKTVENNEDDTNSVEQTSHKADDVFVAIDSVRRMHGDRHLRSCCEIVNYHIQANDGEIGRLKTMLIDDDNWAIQCFVTTTSDLWFGHQVLLKPQAIKDISWGNAKIYVGMTQQQVKEAPLFDLSPIQKPRYELGVYLHQEQNSYGKTETDARQIN
ncbi:MAG: PRC-barrel domain containing protein [Gammaproteobacteria bacterium]|nr:MAG: PRC-barrel domain containing protein [Gammaproteobacteria bacterium]